jgi:hypothetical protein|tara:strand:+ start:548 stop:781 length:234 start_codon:yes stop_codon:yes gene_type:complete
MQLSRKTIETCIDALEVLAENSEETIICCVGHDWDEESLRELVAAGPDQKTDEWEIGEIQDFLERRAALGILKQHVS